jgi:hypothetical protein
VAACLVAVLTLVPVSGAFGQTVYEVTVHNNFGTGEFYNATPQNTQIWLVTDFQFDYQTSPGVWTAGNQTAGSPFVVQLSTISQGKLRLYRTGGSRMYAVLSQAQPAAQIPYPSTTQPCNYFEWSFSGGVPGVLDLSWIDRWDFLTRLEVSNLPASAPTMVYGSKQRQSTAAVGRAMAGYASQTQYAWLGTGTGGFSQALAFPGATNPIGWVTQNQFTGSGFASGIVSFTQALDQVIATAHLATPWTPAWTQGTPGPGLGPNWSTAGFRVGYPQGMNDPDTGGTAGSVWTAYVGFTGNSTSGYTMTLTDFTLYDSSGNCIWSAVQNAAGATYSVTQEQGLLDCIWTSSWNNLQPPQPAWVTNLGNSNGVMYAVYNALASGLIYLPDFVTNTQLNLADPKFAGYIAWIKNALNYSFEIFTKGAQVTNDGTNNGLAGSLQGQDMINLLNSQGNQMMNPYFLALLRTQEVTPAYLYPSQDELQFKGIAGASPVLGLQPQPLSTITDFGDNAKLDWYLGGGLNPNITGALMLLLLD